MSFRAEFAGPFRRTEQWDCGGSDIGDIAVTASGEDDVVACALACVRERNCVGFVFPLDAASNGHCWLKQSIPAPPACGQHHDHYDYYAKLPGHTENCGGHNSHTEIGCADGSAEAVFSPGAVGCDTSWQKMGLQEGEKACAAGWHICLDADEAAQNGVTAETCDSAAAAGTFYATYESSGGYCECATARVATVLFAKFRAFQFADEAPLLRSQGTAKQTARMIYGGAARAPTNSTSPTRMHRARS